jgi:pimeloyl-ACP methyl ester carboxylesterase
MGRSPDARASSSLHTRLMTEIRIDGAPLYYEEHGDGEPILCIHGTGSSSVLWVDAAAELAKRGRTILYDRRGFSRSGPAEHATGVRRHTDDAAALLAALGAGPAVVIGRSQGGEIALDLALRYPEKVRALALLEGGGLSLGEGFRRWNAALDARILAAADTDVTTVGETLLRAVLGDEAWEGMPEALKEMFTANGAAIAAESRGGLLDVTVEQLGSVTHPALLVAGEDSPPEFTEVTRILAANLPSARVEWVEGGHLINPAHPAVLRFVDEVFALR